MFAAIGSHLYPEHNSNTIETIAVVLFAIPACIAVIHDFGLKKGVVLLSLLYVFAIAIESFGIVTGFPYGSFTYGSFSAGYRFFDITPWTVGFAWVPNLIGAYYIASYFQKKRLNRILLTTLFLLIFDLVLDPVAVFKGYWAFENGGFYYNVAFTNFLGWIVSGCIGATILAYTRTSGTLLNLRLGTFSMILHLVFMTTTAFLSGIFVPGVIGILFTCFILYTVVRSG